MPAVSTMGSPCNIASPCNLSRKRLLSPESACRRSPFVRHFTVPSPSTLAVDLNTSLVLQSSPISKTPRRCLLSSLRSSETPVFAEPSRLMEDDDIFKCTPPVPENQPSPLMCLPPPSMSNLFGSPLARCPPRESPRFGLPADFTLKKAASFHLIDESPIRQFGKGMGRKITAPPPKLRKMHSMCELEEQFIYGDSLKSEADDSHGESYILPCHTTKKDTLKRITCDTLSDVLKGKYDEAHDKLIVIDCRFPYEYEGGHIQDAINVNTKESLDAFFRENTQELNSRTIIVFHCEYSSHRAPRMAHHLRTLDRELNAVNYPHLSYPELYVLDGGYRNFFAQNAGKPHCVPQNYVEMDDECYKIECKTQMAKFTKSFNQKLKNKSISWSRSKSF
ncbi:m-phase inducer phosphatase [Basidiobolus ranarum]|uniref:M-phase inducer phosphatase n=1 Tax=Basidiobolus ranarum TaxID=34480 RepID=A0ABR2X1Y5_9FUNG